LFKITLIAFWSCKIKNPLKANPKSIKRIKLKNQKKKKKKKEKKKEKKKKKMFLLILLIQFKNRVTKEILFRASLAQPFLLLIALLEN